MRTCDAGTHDTAKSIRSALPELREATGKAVSKRQEGDVSWLRHMRTTQERRRFYADAAEGVKLRNARSPISLPNLWDDIGRSLQRSWKKHRKIKWRRIAQK
jgi:hypothetical protein